MLVIYQDYSIDGENWLFPDAGNEANKQAMSLEIKYSQKIRVSPTSHFHDRCSESENN